VVEGDSEQVPEIETIRLDWSGITTVPAQHVNQVIGQLGPPTNGIPDGIYLALGSVEPPIVTDAESRARVVEELRAAGAKVDVRGRFHLTRQLADEVIRILQETEAQYDAAVHAAKASSGGQVGTDASR
jgi:hypothetical protein